MQHREQQPQIARDRVVQRKRALDRGLNLEEEAVDLVVERDHLVRKLDVLLAESADRAVQGRQDPLTLLLELRLEPVECLVHRHARHRTPLITGV